MSTVATQPAALIIQAQKVSVRAKSEHVRIPGHAAAELGNIIADLDESLEFHHRIAGGDLAPEQAYGMCSSLPESEWLQVALTMAAEEAMYEADEVIKVIQENCSEEVAQWVRDGWGEQ